MSMLPFGRPLGGIIQYAYTVADISASMRAYTAEFGVGPWFFRGPFSPQQARYRGNPTAMTITLARAFVGETMIELIQQHDQAPSVYREFIDRAGHGFHHWAIGTADLAADLARFAARGWPVAFEDVVPSGARVVYLDATPELPGMVEIVEMNEAMQAMYDSFYRASVDWDGSDPIREG